jgi:UDP-N-acetylmuramoylalanine--D-glutamate ligase
VGGCLKVSFISSLSGKSVVVFGAGVTGQPTIEFLNSKSAKTILVDEKLASPEISNDLSNVDLDKVDFAVVSPGWKVDNPLILELKRAGVSIISEIDLAWRVKQEIRPQQKWLALTGTNGKTTAVQMAEAMLVADGQNAMACGNIGLTAIEAVINSEADILILELSSFQLEWSVEAQFVSVAILNIAEDHIDWHGSFDNYANAKFKITNNAETVILNALDSAIVRRAKNLNHPIIWFSLETPKPHQIGLVENLIVDRAFITDEAEALFELADINPAVPHNVLNAMAAAGLARSVGSKAESIAQALRSFKLDHHRLEVVAERNGVIWIDDSKATNPHAAMAALNSQLKSIWIAGGLAKGATMDELVKSCSSRIKAAILIGSDASLIASALEENAPEIPIHHVNEYSDSLDLMNKVVAVAAGLVDSGDTVLLAPACASMDQFKNYSERGQLFAQAVKGLLNE